MTRFNNSLAPSQQATTSQGRPAAPGYAPQHPQQQPVEPVFDAHAWAAQVQAQERQRRGQGAAPAPAQTAGYDLGYGDPHAAVHHDPLAALRPDGYGYAPPQTSASDPFGVAGYGASPAPQPHGYGQGTASSHPLMPSAPSSHYAPAPGEPHAAVPGYDGYGGDPFQAGYGAGNPSLGYGAGNGPQFGAHPQSQPGYAAGYGGSGLSAQGYGPAAAQPEQDPWAGAGQGFNLDPQDVYHGYGDPAQDPHAQQQWGHAGGYDQAGYSDPALGAQDYAAQSSHHGAFDQSYAEDEAQFDAPAPPRSWKKIAAVMACTLVAGVGIAFAYNGLLAPDSDEPTPVVKGLDSPSKVRPSDPGGKKFAHTDSKIMGRLGEGGAAATADPRGVKKVPIVTVGRDGQIQPPGNEDTRAVVTVPGLTVIDGLGNSGPVPGRQAAPPAGQPAPVEMVNAAQKADAQAATKPPAKIVGKAKADAAETAAAVPVKPAAKAALPKPERTASLPDTPAPTGPKPTGAGYVAVLASVPASGSSRMSALAQFADMQQRYGSILQNKTPDIQEANLGAKGTYHRLLVGPPGSRDSANSVCAQLKAEGYSSCWVTAY